MHLKAGTKHLKVTINCVMQRWRVNLHCVLRNGKGSFGSTIFGGHFHSPGTRRISSATLKQRVVKENFFSPSEVFKLKKAVVWEFQTKERRLRVSFYHHASYDEWNPKRAKCQQRNTFGMARFAGLIWSHMLQISLSHTSSSEPRRCLVTQL